MLPNPYRPGAGMSPAYLAGRDNTINEAQNILQAINYGYSARSVVYYGLRGVGKTVLLNYIENLADEMDLPSEYMEIAERDRSFQYQIALHIYKLINRLSLLKNIESHIKKALSILKAFTIKYGCDDISIEVNSANGISDTGNLANDMTELFLALGVIAQKQKKGVVLFIDEVQYIKDDEFEALMEAIHRTNQKNYPIVIFSAGLPKIAKIAGDVKSYAERLFDFIEIDSLNNEEAKLALIEPAKRFQINYTDEAVNKIIEITQGYPYFLQEYGKWVWECKKEESIIDIKIVNKAYDKFEQSLDKAFFKVRHDRATAREIEFMTAMVACEKLPCSTKEIANIMGESIQAISPLRAQLIHKGFIYAAKRGEVDFTVPQFDKYLKRVYNS
ncbi:ATP-binding protein [Megamonas funiformis]|uniref:ATP-binding protein n=1 Tax=Megamonas funiformis TaxID=437897 RepID=UPI0014316495|nr:ATP-binding protein [Megamonas funiformis]NJE28488.1 ATP-binding protein [Megamonas funiformis]